MACSIPFSHSASSPPSSPPRPCPFSLLPPPPLLVVRVLARACDRNGSAKTDVSAGGDDGAWNDADDERSIRLERRRGGENDVCDVGALRRGEGGIGTAVDEEGVGSSEAGSSTNAADADDEDAAPRSNVSAALNGSRLRSRKTRSSRASCARLTRSTASVAAAAGEDETCNPPSKPASGSSPAPTSSARTPCVGRGTAGTGDGERAADDEGRRRGGGKSAPCGWGEAVREVDAEEEAAGASGSRSDRSISGDGGMGVAKRCECEMPEETRRGERERASRIKPGTVQSSRRHNKASDGRA